MQHSSLEALGWDGWFAEQARSCCDLPGVARVVAVDRGQWLLLDDTGTFRARLAGKYLYRSASAGELPCVGDWVCVERSSAGQEGRIRGVLGRKTGLRRKAAGTAVEYQMIAANVDFVIIVQSCHYDFNLKRLERYLVMVRDGGAEPYVLLSKTDLVGPEVLAAQIAQIRDAGVTTPVLALSNVAGDGVAELKAMLLPGKTYCFVGSSGVGKSTLINSLVGRAVLETSGVSGTGEGRHTSVRRELVVLDNGALVIDNPGMREFGVLAAEESIEASYADIAALAAQCRYRNCTHGNEPGCAVRQALESGVIDAGHYGNFIKLRRESEHHQLSYVEQRKKDKAFGRFLKAAKKGME